MGEVFTASNGKAETAVSNTQEKEHPSRDWFPSGSWFWVTPVSVSAQMVLGALQVCREEVEVEEGGTDLQTGMIPILGSPPWCSACAHALISLGIITLGSTLSYIQMENIKKNGDVMSLLKISVHFLLQPMGQRQPWKKGHSSCLWLISALIGLRPILLQLIYFLL